jgi:hypothetical protein
MLKTFIRTDFFLRLDVFSKGSRLSLKLFFLLIIWVDFELFFLTRLLIDLNLRIIGYAKNQLAKVFVHSNTFGDFINLLVLLVL